MFIGSCGLLVSYIHVYVVFALIRFTESIWSLCDVSRLYPGDTTFSVK